MPKVKMNGKTKHFPYTKEGMKGAQKMRAMKAMKSGRKGKK